MRAINSQRWGRGAWIALLAATAVAAGGCAKQQVPAVQQAAVQRPGPRPTPAPSFRALPDSTPRADLLAYARGLQFDSTSPAADAQYVAVGSGEHLVLGPYVMVEPEIGAWFITREDLERGRILAKFVVKGHSGALGLPLGVSYAWIDSTGGGFRELLVPEDPNVPLVRSPVRFYPGLGGPFARIGWSDSTGRCCITKPCTGGLCCDVVHCAGPRP